MSQFSAAGIFKPHSLCHSIHNPHHILALLYYPSSVGGQEEVRMLFPE